MHPKSIRGLLALSALVTPAVGFARDETVEEPAASAELESEARADVGNVPENVIIVTARRRQEAAQDVVPALRGVTGSASAAVRAGTPDGLPLVGWSAEPGVFLTVGARRNGWLLAPLVAAITAAYLAGEDPGPFAGQLDARRFVKGDR